jgi:16S rRNA (cytidine1402-2'-O)-methyltransferase
VEVLGYNEVVFGELVVVATPIGNLGDISRRALELLTSADVVYCEDTRHSRTLFSAHGIPVKGRLHSLHEHNEVSQCEDIVARVREGQVVVLISDAGTPGISDPGSRVVAAVAEAGLRVTTAPGPAAVIAALTISGLATDRFVMEGFVGRKVGERELLYRQWIREPRTIVFYESPQRLSTTLNELSVHFAERRVAVVREITKFHEEVVRGTVRDVADIFGARDVLGEIVVVLAGAPAALAVDDETVRAALVDQMASGLSVRDAVSYVADTLGVAHRSAYQLALQLRASEGS